jgi:hypothetical protein
MGSGVMSTGGEDIGSGDGGRVDTDIDWTKGGGGDRGVDLG